MLRKMNIFDAFFMFLIMVLRPQKLLISNLVISTNEVFKILLNVGKKLKTIRGNTLLIN